MIMEERGIVSCDKECKAFEEPKSLEEYKKALDHWMNHSNLAGCSHGC